MKSSSDFYHACIVCDEAYNSRAGSESIILKVRDDMTPP